MKDDFLFYTYDNDKITDAADMTRCLVSFATEFGLEGNIWHQWLTYSLMTDENPFSLACERRKIREDSTLLKLARPDLAQFRPLTVTAVPSKKDTPSNSRKPWRNKDLRSILTSSTS